MATVAKALGATKTVVIPQAGVARSAAYVITAIEGGQLHLPRLRDAAAGFRSRHARALHGGRAAAGRRGTSRRSASAATIAPQVQKLFEEVDIILAPATPCTAPKLGQVMMKLGGVELPVRANLGLFTQPISFIGLPVVAAPLQQPGRPADRRADHRQPLQRRRRAARRRAISRSRASPARRRPA